MHVFAETAVASTPWWGVPVVAGAFTILGVVAAQLVTWMLDRGRAAREDARRWHSDRRQAYAESLQAFETWARHVYFGWGREEFDITENIRLTTASDRALGQVDLMASSPVREAARAIDACLMEFVGKRINNDNAEDVRGELASEYYKRKVEFVAAARKELGVDM